MGGQNLVFSKWVEGIGLAVDGVGVLVIVLGALFSTASFLFRSGKTSFRESYTFYRQNLGRIILLGLEFLVAGDIIRTVAVSPTFTSLGLLSIIIMIRFVLSLQLEMEVEGVVPWRKKK